MTKQEAAIVSAYTGYLIGEFGPMHEYIEKIIGRPVFTHELGSSEMSDRIREAAKPDFVGIKIDAAMQEGER